MCEWEREGEEEEGVVGDGRGRDEVGCDEDARRVKERLSEGLRRSAKTDWQLCIHTSATSVEEVRACMKLRVTTRENVRRAMVQSGKVRGNCVRDGKSERIFTDNKRGLSVSEGVKVKRR